MTEVQKLTFIYDVAIFSSLLLFYFIKKDEINSVLGYRTKLSMKNEENWNFAQSFFSKNWLYSIFVVVITQIPIFFGNDLKLYLYISVLNFLIYTIYLIFITEKKLKKRENLK